MSTTSRIQARSGCASSARGGGAAAAALHLVALTRKWARQTKGIGFKLAGEEIRIAGAPKDTGQA
ncbi:MAG: hypothetical protein KC635_27165, partial [Myxococcales bacterium]|nr:hypothetical protein [Myxococcales bacterium]